MKRKTLLVLLIIAFLINIGLAKDLPNDHHCLKRPGFAKLEEPAPDFSVDAVIEKEFKQISLSDYKGKWLVLFFYPGDFTFVCPTEIKGFSQSIHEFKKLNAEIIGGSVDSKYSHLAWIQKGDLGDLKFPLFSDLKKEMVKSYGVLAKDGTALRGLFIIDPNGILQYQLVQNHNVGRSVEEILRVLAALQTEALCPLNWKKGQKTLGK